MSGLSRREKKLSEALLNLSDEAMILEELDGFLAGILVCPEMIPPSAWLPVVWNSEGGEQLVFDDIDQMNKVIGLVMEHYNALASALFDDPESYGPLFASDSRNGEVLWELWIEGFENAVKLRPEAWQALLNADLYTIRAWTGLMKLADVGSADPRFTKAELDAITADAHTKIPGWVLDLNDWCLASHSFAGSLGGATSPASLASATKVGRNDSCPCGSGKKYKKSMG